MVEFVGTVPYWWEVSVWVSVYRVRVTEPEQDLVTQIEQATIVKNQSSSPSSSRIPCCSSLWYACLEGWKGGLVDSRAALSQAMAFWSVAVEELVQLLTQSHLAPVLAAACS